MMKKIAVLSLMIFLVAGCAAPEKPAVKTELGLYTPYSYFPEILNGKVKKLTEKNFVTKMADGKAVVDRILTKADRDSVHWTNDFIVTFNEDGLVVQSDEIDENGTVLYSTRTLVENGKIVKASYFIDDTLKSYQLNEYDSNGWLDRIENYSADDSLNSVMDVGNDTIGNITSVAIYSPQNELKTTFESNYNENNRRLGYKFVNAEGIKTFEQIYSYNDKGFLEKQILINKEGAETIVTYTFDSDESGNWFECLANDGKNMVITKRTLEYYD